MHVTATLAQISHVLGKVVDAERFSADTRRLKATFQSKYAAPSGLLVGDTQTALSLAIVFHLLSNPEQIANATSRLALLVRQAAIQVSNSHCICKDSDHYTCSGYNGLSTAGIPHAIGERLPVVDVPNYHGCYHHLGALG